MLAIHTLDASAIDPAVLDAVWSLYRAHHDTTREAVEARLGASIRQLHLFRDGADLCGFLGTRREVVEIEGGERIGAIYLGFGFVRPQERNRQLIQRTVCSQILRFRLRHPRLPFYFWTDALSYKPYLVIARNNRHFHPSRHGLDPRLSAVADALGRRTYGELYADGVVRKPAKLLRDGVAEVGDDDLRDPDIAHFVRCNPGHARGDGLLLVLPVTFENLRFYLARAVRRARR
ncbi:MAG: hypothetical protein H6737_06345 [Alphaproteobacteria bacterium]|nr:hypothetical protein [Alphaproteobacteria bacterium]